QKREFSYPTQSRNVSPALKVNHTRAAAPCPVGEGVRPRMPGRYGRAYSLESMFTSGLALTSFVCSFVLSWPCRFSCVWLLVFALSFPFVFSFSFWLALAFPLAFPFLLALSTPTALPFALSISIEPTTINGGNSSRSAGPPSPSSSASSAGG